MRTTEYFMDSRNFAIFEFAMPVVHFTFHAYRGWRESHPRGYIQRGARGVQPPSPGLERHRSRVASDRPVRFEPARTRRLLTEWIVEIATTEDWRVHGVVVTPTHIHLVMSWVEGELREVAARLKRILGVRLAREFDTPGRTWFARGWGARRLANREHLAYLLEVYLPKHQQHEAGVLWTEFDGS
ncbi:MAG: hypothetical protein ACF8PN_06215 [Phycisphaerales bacterium]